MNNNIEQSSYIELDNNVIIIHKLCNDNIKYHLHNFDSVNSQRSYTNSSIPNNTILELWEKINGQKTLIGLINSTNLGYNTSYYRTNNLENCYYKICLSNIIYFLCMNFVKSDKFYYKQGYYYDYNKLLDDYNLHSNKNSIDDKFLDAYVIKFEMPNSVKFHDTNKYNISKNTYSHVGQN